MPSLSRRQKNTFLKMAAILGGVLFVLLVVFTTRPASPTNPTNSTSLASPTPDPSQVPATASPTAEATRVEPKIIASPSPNPSPTPTPTALPPDFWKKLPVIPAQISARAREIYRVGLSMGNQAHIFSRIGDCASAAPDFLVGFDQDYNLGEYTSLQPAIDYFKGSFERPSLAAKAGLNSSGLLTTLWTDKQCQANESLLDCQYRLDRPSFVFLSIGTNEAYYVTEDPGSFEKNMRIILDDTISKGILPILSTKADNIEGDGSINATLARLAMEYELPLWNFWLAVQPLPEHGMASKDHLNSVSYRIFTDFTLPNSLEYGMQVRNLTALQMLDFLRKELGE